MMQGAAEFGELGFASYRNWLHDMSESRKILCKECGEESVLVKKPVYEDFQKTGERLFCASCGCEFDSIEKVHFSEGREHSLFGKEELEPAPSIFDESESIRTCRRCTHYVINPFTQRCGLHDCTVESTDTCNDFELLADTEDTDRDK
jgi:hypothetical protein